MYAVFESGGKQYRVSVGDRVKVESLQAEPGAEVRLENVLLVADGKKLDVGAPYTGTTVSAKVLQHGRGPKLRLMKLRRRQNSRQRAGHRQNFTELEITRIDAKAPDAPKPAPKQAEETAARKTKKKKTKKEVSAETPAKPKKKAKKKTATKKPAGDGELTQLSGVGPVLADKLQQAGVTSLEQIAEWTEKDAARLDEELDLKGRIQRDDWVGQARKLIKKSG